MGGRRAGRGGRRAGCRSKERGGQRRGAREGRELRRAGGARRGEGGLDQRAAAADDKGERAGQGGGWATLMLSILPPSWLRDV